MKDFICVIVSGILMSLVMLIDGSNLWYLFGGLVGVWGGIGLVAYFAPRGYRVVKLSNGTYQARVCYLFTYWVVVVGGCYSYESKNEAITAAEELKAKRVKTKKVEPVVVWSDEDGE